jgi:hypothetical protein
MGFYINPHEQSKEEWLQEHAWAIADEPFSRHYYKHVNMGAKRSGSDLVQVCLVDNGQFTALAIAFCENELLAFNSPLDRRRKLFALVPAEATFPYLYGQKIEGREDENED